MKGAFWKCRNCDYTVNGKGNMRTHVEVHHGPTKHKCKYCDNETKTSRGLAKHMLKKHGIKLKKKAAASKEKRHIPWDEYRAMKRAIKVLSNKIKKGQYLRHLDNHKVDKATCQCKIDFKF